MLTHFSNGLLWYSKPKQLDNGIAWGMSCYFYHNLSYQVITLSELTNYSSFRLLTQIVAPQTVSPY